MIDTMMLSFFKVIEICTGSLHVLLSQNFEEKKHIHKFHKYK